MIVLKSLTKEAMDIKNALEKTRAKGQDLKGDLSNDNNIPHNNSSVNKSSNKSKKSWCYFDKKGNLYFVKSAFTKMR